MIKSNFKELSKEEYEKLSEEDKKKYAINKINRLNILKLDKDKQ